MSGTRFEQTIMEFQVSFFPFASLSLFLSDSCDWGLGRKIQEMGIGELEQKDPEKEGGLGSRIYGIRKKRGLIFSLILKISEREN